MDVIAKLDDREIPQVMGPTMEAFLPLLEGRRSIIKSVPVKTFIYGTTQRHKLDVYYPPRPIDGGGAPVLFFVYGGGFVTGERVMPSPADLVYANVATYFTSKGFITVVPDYRLVPHVTFPAPAEDVRDAVRWVSDNLSQHNEDNLATADTECIFLMGHSAGACHVATMMLYPELSSDELKKRIKGVILISSPYHLSPTKNPRDWSRLIGMYWGSDDEARRSVPLSLLRSLSEKEALEFPSLLVVEAERDPEWMLEVSQDFYAEGKRKKGIRIEKVFAGGHNHISLSWALASGQGEEWAEAATKWMREPGE